MADCSQSRSPPPCLLQQALQSTALLRPKDFPAKTVVVPWLTAGIDNMTDIVVAEQALPR